MPIEVKQEVRLKATAIVAIKMGNGLTKLVLFKPAAGIQDLIYASKNQDVDLVIEDQNGAFTPEVPQMILGFMYERGNDTMIVDTIHK